MTNPDDEIRRHPRTIEQDFEGLFRTMRSKRFRNGEDTGGEPANYIYAYPPEQELEVERRIPHAREPSAKHGSRGFQRFCARRAGHRFVRNSDPHHAGSDRYRRYRRNTSPGCLSMYLDKTSKAYEVYQKEEIQERHRHRYEVNNDYREVLTENGMNLCGLSPDGKIVEMAEIKDHPWFIATQAHPELKSRPNKPHPLFKGFVEAAAALDKH